MRLIVQKVSKSSVKIEGEMVGKINKGYMVLVGITDGDDETLVGKMVDKLVNLRIFEDENDKLNLSLLDVQGSILSISQFPASTFIITAISTASLKSNRAMWFSAFVTVPWSAETRIGARNSVPFLLVTYPA